MHSKGKSKNKIKEFSYIIVGTMLLAMAINMFFNPNKLIIGGFTGLGIVINAYIQKAFNTEISLSIINIILNVPLFIVAYKILGKGIIGRTVFATLFLSVALEITKILPVFSGDMLLAAVYGGVISGAGIGMVFRGLATTGGVDLVASIVHRFKGHIAVSKIMFVCDATIVALGFFVFGATKAMYAVIAIFISSKCIDTILEGMSFSKVAFIISDKSVEISNEILQSAHRGVTTLKGKGMYTGYDKDVILCVFAQKEITKIKEIVEDIDNDAFMIVTDIKEVLGEGFETFK